MIILFFIIFYFIQYENYKPVPKELSYELIECIQKDEDLKEILNLWLYKYHADRVFIIQYHNSTKDWQHGTMRFEICKENVVSIKCNFVNFNLTWLDMPFYLQKNNYFIGNIYSLQKIDRILYNQLNNYNINNVAFVIIKDNDEIPIGILGFTGNNLNINSNSLLNESKIIYEYIK